MESNQKIRVSVVDDQPLFRPTIFNAFNHLPHFTAPIILDKSKDLIGRLKQECPDILLIDLADEWYELAYSIKKKTPQIKIIIPSAYPGKDVASCHKIKREIHNLLLNGVLNNGADVKKRLTSSGHFFSEYILLNILVDIASNLTYEYGLPPTIKRSDLKLHEQKVISLLCHDYSNQEIADKLSVSVRTVEGYRSVIMEKLGVAGVAGIVMYGVLNKLHTKFGYQKYRAA